MDNVTLGINTQWIAGFVKVRHLVKIITATFQTQSRDGEEKTKYLSKIIFKRELRNRECVKRDWLLYLPSPGRLLCVAYCLI